MKEHILAALEEQFQRWEDLLSSLTERQVSHLQFDLDWSIKDVMAHLWAWQQISIARLEGGANDKEPEYPSWIVASIENWEEDADRVNALTFETQHNRSWLEIYQSWREGFIRFLELGKKISERNLLDGGRYPWLEGHSLASILVASYDHHQEHIEKLSNWLQKHQDF